MCSQWVDLVGALPAPGFPEGWSFLFQNPQQVCPSKHKHNSSGRSSGLILLASNGRRYNSFEDALSRNKKVLSCDDIQVFQRYVGLEPRTGKGSRCGKCSLCRRTPCGKCFACCRDNKNGCVQKVSVFVSGGGFY